MHLARCRCGSLRRAWKQTADPADQANIPHSASWIRRVIDERMDLDMLDGVAAARPDWQLVIIGPVAKIDPAVLPRRQNIHYLGVKTTRVAGISGGLGCCPATVCRNDQRRFISLTKPLSILPPASLLYPPRSWMWFALMDRKGWSQLQTRFQSLWQLRGSNEAGCPGIRVAQPG